MARVHKKRARRTRSRKSHRYDREGSEVVQMLPAWADSVLLYWGSPVEYEHSGLDDGLIAELKAWDASYYDQVGVDDQGRSQTLQDAHRIEGVRLARGVADALGRAFVVEFEQRMARSRHRPTTPAAAAAFKAHGAKREAELQMLMDQNAQSADFGDRSRTPDHSAAKEPGQWLREVRSMTTRRVRVRLSPDFSVGFPVEVVVNGRPGYVDADMLGISASLRRDLEDFQNWWEQHAWDDDNGIDASEDSDWAQWSHRGSRLVERLQSEVGDDYYVTWA